MKWLSYSREICYNCSKRRTPFFPQFLENSRSHSNAYSTLTFSKKTHLLNMKEIDDSKENMSGINDEHQNYEMCECKFRIVIAA